MQDSHDSDGFLESFIIDKIISRAKTPEPQTVDAWRIRELNCI